MPRKTALAAGTKSDSQIDYQELKRVAEEIVLPNLDKILAKMVSEALGDGKAAQAAREYLINRLFGKPTEHIQQETRQAITVTVRPISPTDTIEGEVIEGEVRVLPAIDDPQLLPADVSGQGPAEAEPLPMDVPKPQPPKSPKAKRPRVQVRETEGSDLGFEV